jgi:hypothetical protein
MKDPYVKTDKLAEALGKDGMTIGEPLSQKPIPIKRGGGSHGE